MTSRSVAASVLKHVATGIAAGLTAMGALLGNKPHPGPQPKGDERADYRP